MGVVKDWQYSRIPWLYFGILCELLTHTYFYRAFINNSHFDGKESQVDISEMEYSIP